ncbi:thiol-disulfide oxidoreductase DCC family protein [Stutzerimonas marianensis]|uniref:thiol-disulfide oxidoreductase DCC family protein n=1 Tax=Stutzerimonas marianensis TaxID=2929513 RepID=UPI003C2F4D34
MSPALPLTLFVDGACPLCAREIAWLRRHADPARLQLVDINDPDFAVEGRSTDQLRAKLHALSANGQWLTGLDATYWSWRAAGLHTWAAPLGWRPLRPLLLAAYRLFSLARPYLAWLPHPDGARRCADRCKR